MRKHANHPLWLAFLFCSLFPSCADLEDVASYVAELRLIGQRESRIGPISVQLTAVEERLIPAVIVVLHNDSEHEVWWKRGGGRSRSGSWSVQVKERSGSMSGARGCSPVRKERAPTPAELQSWSMLPGESRMFVRRYKTPPPGSIHGKRFLLWSTRFDTTVPLEAEPSTYYGAWAQKSLQVKVNPRTGTVQFDF
jgi:hypothetical protein